jgi:hypothetical protein
MGERAVIVITISMTVRRTVAVDDPATVTLSL